MSLIYFFKVQWEFSVESTTNFFSRRQPLQKIFADQSEVNAPPSGCARHKSHSFPWIQPVPKKTRAALWQRSAFKFIAWIMRHSAIVDPLFPKGVANPIKGPTTYYSVNFFWKLHGTRYAGGYSQNFESSSFVAIDYKWLPPATTQLVVENSELELWYKVWDVSLTCS